MRGLCKDCKHWQAEGYADSAGTCRLIDSDSSLPKDVANGEAHATVASYWGDYGGYLVCGPEFGCVQFEEKQ